jgi:DUF1365 family protein
MQFRSKIVRGEVTHKRLTPTAHAFKYPYTFFMLDLEELPQLDQASFFFNHNSPGLLQLHDRDYLKREPRSIEDQLNEFLPSKKTDERTLLISSPSYLGYAFNPVNFHLRLKGNTLTHAVAEVNNTFGDSHVYPLKSLKPADDGITYTASCPKDFHVSPFNDMQGSYRFTFRLSDETIFCGVDLYHGEECTLQTWMRGCFQPLTTRNITKYALLHPFDTALNSMPRITWQAAQLYYKRKLTVFSRPSPVSKHTLIDRDQPEPKRRVI